MNKNSLKESIEKIWSNRKELSKSKSKKDFNIIMETIKKLDNGEIRVSEKINGQWILNQWVKKAVLLSFQVTNQKLILNGPGKSYWWDKVPSKFEGWKFFVPLSNFISFIFFKIFTIVLDGLLAL